MHSVHSLAAFDSTFWLLTAWVVDIQGVTLFNGVLSLVSAILALISSVNLLLLRWFWGGLRSKLLSLKIVLRWLAHRDTVHMTVHLVLLGDCGLPQLPYFELGALSTLCVVVVTDWGDGSVPWSSLELLTFLFSRWNFRQNLLDTRFFVLVFLFLLWDRQLSSQFFGVF